MGRLLGSMRRKWRGSTRQKLLGSTRRKWRGWSRRKQQGGTKRRLRGKRRQKKQQACPGLRDLIFGKAGILEKCRRWIPHLSHQDQGNEHHLGKTRTKKMMANTSKCGSREMGNG